MYSVHDAFRWANKYDVGEKYLSMQSYSGVYPT